MTGSRFASRMNTAHFTILVAEDSIDDQIMIERAFRKAGVIGPIQFVENGAEAIAYLNGHGKFADREKFQYPRFIITDLKMPGIDGLSILDNLRKNPLWAIIPTVVFSSSMDRDDIKKAYYLGASAYHIKPSNPADFQKQIRILYEYWLTCEVPAVDETGKQLPTQGEGKLGERFPGSSGANHHRQRDES